MMPFGGWERRPMSRRVRRQERVGVGDSLQDRRPVGAALHVQPRAKQLSVELVDAVRGLAPLVEYRHYLRRRRHEHAL